MSSQATTTPPAPVLKKPVKLACIQLASGPDKAANLAHAASQVRKAASQGANIVVLPECFNSPYGCQFFPSYAETLLPSPPTPEQSPSYHALSTMAAENKIYLIGGSIPEKYSPAASTTSSPSPSQQQQQFYNTSLTFDPHGTLLGTHRKTHLFDIDIPGKITFKESDVLSPGNNITLIHLPEYGSIAVAICYDIRFPEMATVAARRGAFALVYPGAFNMTTGPLHWKLLARARAVDNQVYVAVCSPARDLGAGYHAWGHSMVVDPMARVLVEAGEKGEVGEEEEVVRRDGDTQGEMIVQAELRPDVLAETRRNIPLGMQRRFDVYPDVSAWEVRYEEQRG
ncbi:hypothetical protein E4U60_001485 [Claviceps pazoutovae]|uniref:CN hydrolase domain-containing protein n=1 Tax=Claviceps pazoutovae TaxID=1649127 RepID=A0A9P7SJZ0_9HYPO|nr:hypothetical protein E4U60_001485 [Claviceps pazoutovae]